MDWVAPHVGAWIEILILKRDTYLNDVAPHVGAWIEIEDGHLDGHYLTVAPHVGAWIEIILKGIYKRLTRSHPTWVRGLKYQQIIIVVTYFGVAPHVGAWIEMPNSIFILT